MRGSIRHITAESRDSDAGGFIVWVVVYALFMVAMIALNGGGHSLGYRQIGFSETAIR